MLSNSSAVFLGFISVILRSASRTNIKIVSQNQDVLEQISNKKHIFIIQKYFGYFS